MFFTSADKSYLPYGYPTHGIDKKRITMCCQYTGCIGGHVTVVMTLEVDVIATSHTASTFNDISTYRNVTR